MEIDPLIEQLAFGKVTPKLSRCLGVYLSPDIIYVCEVHTVKGKPVVDHLVRVPVPVPEQGKEPSTNPTLVTDFLADVPKLSALIRQAISQLRWNSKDVIVTLSHHLGLLRYFTMPAVDRRFWKSAIPLEAKKFIPVPLDMLSLDYQVLPMPMGPDNRPRQAALVACVPSKNLPSISALMESLGLRVVGMEVAPCSMLRLWNAVEPAKVREPYAQVHFDGGSVRVLISDKGLPVFFREVFLGPEAYVSDQRKVDLGGCVAFAQKQLGVGNLAAVRISGSTPELAGWKDAFGSELSMTAESHDTAGLLGIKGGDWGGYASVGAALRFIAPSAMTLELSPVGKIGDGERLTVKYFFSISLLASLILAALGAVNHLKYWNKTRGLRAFTPQPDIEALFKGKSPMDIENMIASMQDQLSNLPDLSGAGRPAVVPMLKAMVDALPEKVWLTRILISNPIKPGVSNPAEIRLTGHAMGANVSDEQTKALEFKDKLGRSPALTRIFDDIAIQLSQQAMTQDSGASPVQSERDSYKRKLEARTMFDITMKVRKKT
ncbi:MAG: pilus assembly protein PilM [Elusimicrobia bacterium]|nr:pilus assembly protein PilM [Elusimicrobiota bacterium]